MKNFNMYVKFSTLFTLMTLSLFLVQAHAEQDWEENETVLVARISYIEGQLERYDPETDEWVATAADTPVGINDQLYAGTGTKAEILIPNDTVLRMGSETHVRIVSLSDQLTEIDLVSGTARLYNNSASADTLATTPYGLVSAPAGAAFDLSVDNRNVRVVAVRDTVDFSHHASGIHKMVMAGGTAVVADDHGVSISAKTIDRAWDDWNGNQEALWADRNRRSGESATYLPEPLSKEAYVLDTQGTWQSVYYEGAYYRFWRPLHVGAHWAPFTVGAWSVWRGDRVWVPHEPFGYVTHHYGNWIYTQGFWYWAPPVTRVMIHAGLPLLHIGFGWYPGRVAWISTGVQVGWVPLAPHEPYYCHYPWDRRAIVIAHGAFPRHHDTHHFKHRRHAVMAHRDHAFSPEKRRPAHAPVKPGRPGTRPSRPRPHDSRERPEPAAPKPPPRERIAPEHHPMDNPRPRSVVKSVASPLRNDIRPLKNSREYDREKKHVNASRPSRRVVSSPPSKIDPVNNANNGRFRPTAPGIRPKPAARLRNHEKKIENRPTSRAVHAGQRKVRTHTVAPRQHSAERRQRATISREAVKPAKPDTVQPPVRKRKPGFVREEIERRP